MLIAAGFQPDGMFFRDARKPHWQRGLEHAEAVICDCLTADALPKALRVVSFPLLSELSLKELRQCEDFARWP